MVDICLYGYNIRTGRYRGVELVLHVIGYANMELGVLLKTKITPDYNVLV